jgi:hypothetical protein
MQREGGHMAIAGFVFTGVPLRLAAEPIAALYLGAERTPEHAQGALVTVHDRGAGDALEGGDLAEGEAATEAHLDDGELLGGEYGEVEAGELLGERLGTAMPWRRTPDR